MDAAKDAERIEGQRHPTMQRSHRDVRWSQWNGVPTDSDLAREVDPRLPHVGELVERAYRERLTRPPRPPPRQRRREERTRLHVKKREYWNWRR